MTNSPARSRRPEPAAHAGTTRSSRCQGLSLSISSDARTALTGHVLDLTVQIAALRQRAAGGGDARHHRDLLAGLHARRAIIAVGAPTASRSCGRPVAERRFTASGAPPSGERTNTNSEAFGGHACRPAPAPASRAAGWRWPASALRMQLCVDFVDLLCSAARTFSGGAGSAPAWSRSGRAPPRVGRRGRRDRAVEQRLGRFADRAAARARSTSAAWRCAWLRPRCSSSASPMPASAVALSRLRPGGWRADRRAAPARYCAAATVGRTELPASPDWSLGLFPHGAPASAMLDAACPAVAAGRASRGWIADQGDRRARSQRSARATTTLAAMAAGGSAGRRRSSGIIRNSTASTASSARRDQQMPSS